MFDKINCIKDRKIIGQFTSLKSLVDYIKDSSRKEVSIINKARELTRDSEEYSKIKTSLIPCVIINFKHKSYVQSSTIINPTGYLFLDLDNQDSLGNIDLNYVAAYWRSLSGKGYSIILRVANLNKEYLKESYQEIGKMLSVDYDKAAISKDRLTVLSYDPDAYLNLDSKEIKLTLSKETHFNTIENNFFTGYECNGSKIRFDNLDEMIKIQGIQLKYDENGLFDIGSDKKLNYSLVSIPNMKIGKGKRNVILSSIIHQLVSLNPKVEKSQLLKFSFAINRDKLIPPLEKREFREIFEKKYLRRNNLLPILNGTRRFFYNPELKLSTKQKRILNAKRIGQDKVVKTKEKIRTLLLNWNQKTQGKLTNKKVAEYLQMNIKTINKYCSEIKLNLHSSRGVYILFFLNLRDSYIFRYALA